MFFSKLIYKTIEFCDIILKNKINFLGGTMSSINLTLLTDFYQLTMMQGYYNSGHHKKIAIFDMYYRSNPQNNGYSIIAGVEELINYIQNLSFTTYDISYLRKQNCFTEDFLSLLKDFKFTGDIYAIPEGTVVFPNEPLVIVKATILEAQFIESYLLNTINHQSLIATKASRIKYAAGEQKVLEFGLRRAQGADAGIYGTRASIIGGCDSTSNVLAAKLFNLPISGTHAHSWVMNFDDEITAFREYVKSFPLNPFLLVDTYDTINSGIPNAIIVFNELVEKNLSIGSYGIRLDSGDLAYLSKIARKMLDDGGHKEALICASNDLDEFLIQELKLQGAKIDLWGVGTSLITSKSCPAFGGVYKLVAEIKENGEIVSKIKISENTSKVTNPGVKKVYRLFDKKTNKIKADLITLSHEIIDTTKDLTIFDPISTWKKMTLKADTYFTVELLVPIFLNGSCVYTCTTVLEIREYCKTQLSLLWDEQKRLVNPQIIPVDLSLDLWTLKEEMIDMSIINKK
jgi:nicotinate phosphoribosyltransferase